MAEHAAVNRRVVGSSPTGGATNRSTHDLSHPLSPLSFHLSLHPPYTHLTHRLFPTPPPFCPHSIPIFGPFLFPFLAPFHSHFWPILASFHSHFWPHSIPIFGPILFPFCPHSIPIFGPFLFPFLASFHSHSIPIFGLISFPFHSHFWPIFGPFLAHFWPLSIPIPFPFLAHFGPIPYHPAHFGPTIQSMRPPCDHVTIQCPVGVPMGWAIDRASVRGTGMPSHMVKPC